MEYEVTLRLEIEEDADFLDSTRSHNPACIIDLFENIIYDLDDVKIEEINVEEVQ